MKVSLVDVDGHNFPNFALMKISAFHKAQGDTVDWYNPLFSQPERIYASKVFTFTPDYTEYAPCDPEPIKGGTGYDIKSKLPDEIDRMIPDYTIYPQYQYAIGFLSRGCIRNCSWCVVPRKEGAIRQYDNVLRIAQNRRHVVLMDNNFLANEPDFVFDQLQKMIGAKLNVDFNQALDARLVNDDYAHLLAKVRWLASSGNNRYIRFSCDTQSMIQPLTDAVSLLRKAGYTGQIFVYVLAKEVDESADRISRIAAIDSKIIPFCMPYRNLDGDGLIADAGVKKLARWCNISSIRKTTKWGDYKG